MNNEKYSVENGIKKVIRYIRWLAVISLCAIMLSGVIFVQADEVALVIRFGKLVGQTRAEQVLQPGLHFVFPYIIDKVEKVPVKRIHELRIDDLYTSENITDVISNGYVLTGDSNVIVLDAIIKYKITDPVNYTLEVKDPDTILKKIAISELVKQIEGLPVDSVLTDGKKELTANTMTCIQDQADELNLGIQLEALEFDKLTPPSEVKSYFDDVTSAYVDKTTMIQEANTYKDENILIATAEKEQIINNAVTQQMELTAQAESDVSQFYGLVDEYHENPEVVIERIYRDKINTILNNSYQTIVVQDGETIDNLYLP